ncbi:MAG: hypothetical protein PHY31_08950, partial [Smithellaceae bacterium]|nr:hypothetical protein [Smithellaceae bacterium]
MRRLHRNQFLLALAVLILTATDSAAKIYIDIDAPSLQKFPVAIADFRDLNGTGRQRDLGGWFPHALGDLLEI